MIFGTFDVLHKGHEYLIHYAQTFGTLTIVVARDVNVSEKKKRIHSEKYRQKKLQKKHPETNVILGNKKDFLKVIRENTPDIIVLGYDQLVTQEQLLFFKEQKISIKYCKAYKPNKHKSGILKKNKFILLKEYIKKIINWI